MKTLAELMVSKGCNPVNFAAEIEKTHDEVDFTTRDTGHFGGRSHEHITDVMLAGQRKIFVWSHTQQNGCDALDIWWSVRELKEGSWRVLLEKRYRGSDRYNMDRYTKTFREVAELYPQFLTTLSA